MEVEYVDNMVKWLYDDKEIIYETKELNLQQMLQQQFTLN